MQLEGNTVLITGGASGIGLALAIRWAAAGSNVIICGRRKEVLDDARRQCPSLQTIVCDLEHETERERLACEVIERYSKLNVLINNAGVQQHPPRLVKQQTWKDHAQEICINLSAPLHLTMLLTQHLLQQQRAAIINITSGLSFVPLAFVPTYSATKAALHSFTQSLRYQLQGTSIEVYEVAPPAVNTDLGGVGKHTFGVPVEEFADFAMGQIGAGNLEFGYQSAERSRRASFEERAEIFQAMNTALARNFPV